MDKAERDRLFHECSRVSRLLEEILPPLLDWSVRNPKALKGFAEAMRKASSEETRFPEEWAKATASQVAAASVLRGASRIESFLSAHGRKLSEDSVGFLERLADHPAFFTAFTVEGALQDDLFRIWDCSSGNPLVLFSPSMGELYRMQAQSYLTLLFDNGSCLQTIGPLHYYRGFEGQDFHYYARLLRPHAYDAGGLSGVMTEEPEWFVVLDLSAEVPPFGHQGTVLRSCWSSVTLDAFDPTRLASTFDVAEAKGVHRCRLKDSSPPLDTADLYWNPKERTLFVYTTGLPSYTRIALAVAGQAEIPVEPQWTCTQNMEVTAQRILRRELPVFSYERLFEPDPSPQEKAELEKTNALVREVSDARNHGRSISVEEVAERMGISPETAQEVKKLFERMEHQFDIELDGGLTGVPHLAPSEVRGMEGRLAEVGLFRFRKGEEVARLFAEVLPRVEALRGSTRVSRTVKLLSLATLPDILEEIAQQDWGDPDNHVLKYTLYLLCLKGGELQSSWDYAAEVLRLFWQAVLPGKERVHVRRFTKQYSVWCRQFLVRSGLVEEGEGGASPAVARSRGVGFPGAMSLGAGSPGAASPGAGSPGAGSPGASFPMRASPFLKAWLSLAPPSGERKRH